MPPNLVGEDVDPRLALLSPEARLLALAAAVEGPVAPEEVAGRLLGPLSAVAGTPWLTVSRAVGDRLTLVAAGGDIPAPLLDLAREGIARGPGLAWRALETGRPVYVGRYGAEAGAHPASAALFGGAVAHLPLLGPGGEPWGVLSLAGREREEWPGGLQVALEAVATMVGRALERSRLAREEREAARLRESEGRLRRLFESPMIGVLFWDADGGVTAANNAFLDTVGYSREDFEAGRVDWRELTPPEWVERDAQGMRELVGTGRMAHFEKEFVRRDGSRVPVLVGGALFEGTRTQGVSFILDITERRAAEEEVRRLNAELERRVVERTRELTNARARAESLAALADALETAASPEGVAAVALERLGPTLGASAMFVVRLEGESLRLPTVWGEPPSGVLAALTRPGVTMADMPMFSRARDTGRGVYLDDYMAQPARVAGWTLPPTAYAAQPVRRPDGRLEGFLVAWRGGPRPWLEGERDLLARAAATLALALERAEAAERLEAQKSALEERNSEQETFVYTVSHDLRAPLLAINGMSALLEEAVSSGETDEAAFLLGRVRRNVATMSQLLSDLLTLSRVGRLAEALEPLDLAEVFAAALADLEPRLLERGVAVAVPADCPTVRYPRSEAYQLLANLLGNAAKFAGREGEAPRVVVSCEAAGDWVTVRVSDNGPGVPEAYRERVFDLFKQVNPTAEGTGVGLAIVKRIVERHGGRAWVEDSPPPPEGLGGATFAVTLPAAG